ncbi:hypothetical protein ACS0TY_002078 [Phlomoides rotata]
MEKKSVEKENEHPKNRKKRHVVEAADEKEEVMEKKFVEKETEQPNNRKKRHVAEATGENEETKPPQIRKNKHASTVEA